MNSKVSIVVPVFNTEKYLDRCLESIVNQTYKKLEIIIVDDGSKAECAQLCDDWGKKDSRIKVLHKQNAGLGKARNTGISAATGEYLFFVDSDDYIDENTVESCVECVKETKAEVVCYGFLFVNRQGKVIAKRVPKMPKNIYEEEEIRDVFLPEMLADDPKTGLSANIEMSACAAMFSVKLIREQKWMFVSEREIISEDVYSLLCLYRYVRKIAVLEKAFYFYCENQSSLTHVYKEDRYERIKYFYEVTLSLFDELEYGEEMKKRLKSLYLSFFIGAAKTIVRAKLPYSVKIKKLACIIKDPHMCKVLIETKNFVMNRNKAFFLKMVRKQKIKLCYMLLWLQCKRK